MNLLLGNVIHYGCHVPRKRLPWPRGSSQTLFTQGLKNASVLLFCDFMHSSLTDGAISARTDCRPQRCSKPVYGYLESWDASSPARRTLLIIRTGMELSPRLTRRSSQSSYASRFSDIPSVIADPLCSRRCCLTTCDALCASFTSSPKVVVTVYSFQFPYCHYQTADLWNYTDCHIGRWCTHETCCFIGLVVHATCLLEPTLL